VVAVDDRGENSIIVIAGANAAVDAELVRRHAGTIADAAIVVPENETYKIQELHLPIYHALCLQIEEHFFAD